MSQVETLINIPSSKLQVLKSEKASAINCKLEKLVIPNGNTYDFVEFSKILYLNAQSNYTYIYLVNGRSYCYCKTLGHVAIKLPSNQFYRCHSSYVINMNYIHSIEKLKNNLLCTMQDDSVIPVSRSRKGKLKSWLRDQL